MRTYIDGLLASGRRSGPRPAAYGAAAVAPGRCYLDFTRARPRVRSLTAAAHARILRLNDIETLSELDGYDHRVFDTALEAEAFLEQYLEQLDTLSNARICKSRDLPAILYKRRYMIATLLGLKNHTYRDYKKKWTPGQLFNLHDQVFFLTVRLKSIKSVGGGDYKYDFELP